jgi:hypothetical protein
MVHQTRSTTHHKQQQSTPPRQVRNTYKTPPHRNTQPSEDEDSSVAPSVHSAASIVASSPIHSIRSPSSAPRAKHTSSPSRSNNKSLPPAIEKQLLGKLVSAQREVPLKQFCDSRALLFGTTDRRKIGNRYQFLKTIQETDGRKFRELTDHHNITNTDSPLAPSPSPASAPAPAPAITEPSRLRVQQEAIRAPPFRRSIPPSVIMASRASSSLTKNSAGTHSTEDSK